MNPGGCLLPSFSGLRVGLDFETDDCNLPQDETGDSSASAYQMSRFQVHRMTASRSLCGKLATGSLASNSYSWLTFDPGGLCQCLDTVCKVNALTVFHEWTDTSTVLSIHSGEAHRRWVPQAAPSLECSSPECCRPSSVPSLLTTSFPASVHPTAS